MASNRVQNAHNTQLHGELKEGKLYFHNISSILGFLRNGKIPNTKSYAWAACGAILFCAELQHADRTSKGVGFIRFLQVKFSELTLDMFRMLQAFEREPEQDPPRTLMTSSDSVAMEHSEVSKVYYV